MIVLPQRRRPIAPVIDWNNPLSKGLVFDFDPLAPWDRLGNQAINNGATTITGIGGLAKNFVRASSQFVDLGTTPWANFGAGDFSLEVIFTTVSAATRQIFFGKDVAASAGNRQLLIQMQATGVLGLSWFDAAATGIADLATSATYSANTRYHVIFQRVGASAECWVNGVQQAFVTTGSHTGYVTMASNAISTYLGGRNFTASNQYVDGSIELFRARNRALTPGEVFKLREAPYRIYRGIEIPMRKAAATFNPAWASSANSTIVGGQIAA